jgi:tRNA pseudouridine32 synthase/23S rRNA pseudouridine746 synthase
MQFSAPPRELQVLYADDALLVLDKPAGLLSVPGRGAEKQDCLSVRARSRYPDALVVHRLDMVTSGVMVLARGVTAQRILNRAFSIRNVKKRYIAIADGQLAAPIDGWAVISLPIRVDWPNRPLRIIDHEDGKPSVTRWRVLSHGKTDKTTRLELEPITGRSHQLRVHLQALGHVIIGDALYGSPRTRAMANRLLLHASSIEFQHPVTGEVMRFVSNPAF